MLSFGIVRQLSSLIHNLDQLDGQNIMAAVLLVCPSCLFTSQFLSIRIHELPTPAGIPGIASNQRGKMCRAGECCDLLPHGFDGYGLYLVSQFLEDYCIANSHSPARCHIIRGALLSFTGPITKI